MCGVVEVLTGLPQLHPIDALCVILLALHRILLTQHTQIICTHNTTTTRGSAHYLLRSPPLPSSDFAGAVRW